MRTTDAHSHFLPRAMLAALRSGTAWHGWELDRTTHGRDVLVSGDRLAPFSPSLMDESWPDRITRRRDQDGVDRQAIMVPSFLWNYHQRAAEGAAFCREVNDEVADLARMHGVRIVPIGTLPLQDRAAAIAEVERAVKDLRIGTFSIGTHVRGENLDHPDIVPILDAVCEADASLMIHASYFNRAGESRMGRYDFGNSFGVPLEDSLATMSIVYSGLLDRFPNARIGSCHGGGWIAFGVGRLWLRYLQGRDGAGLEFPPQEYLRRMYFDSLVHDELSLELLVRRAGVRRVMVGTDYPYQGDMPGGAVAWVKGLDFLSRADKSAILDTNATSFFGLANAQ